MLYYIPELEIIFGITIFLVETSSNTQSFFNMRLEAFPLLELVRFGMELRKQWLPLKLLYLFPIWVSIMFFRSDWKANKVHTFSLTET